MNRDSFFLFTPMLHEVAASAQAGRRMVGPFAGTCGDAGLGHISEVFDGDAPRPGGCIAQAWSVAEVLRAAVEDVCGIRPQRPTALLDAVAQEPTEAERKPAAI